MKKAALICERHHVPMRAMWEALSGRGVDCEWRDHWGWSTLPKVDLAVIWGIRAQGKDILDHYKSQGTPVIVMDHGYINRANIVEDYPKKYLYVGMGGLADLPNEYDDTRASRLDYTILKPRTGPIRRALICGQVPHDASHRLGPKELTEVYNRMANKLSDAGIKHIRFRGHPMSPEVRPAIHMAGIRTLNECLDETDLVVTINSNSGLDALLRGLPVMITNRCHYQQCAYPMGHDLALVKPPETRTIQNLVHRLSWAQFLTEEIRQGLPLDKLTQEGKIKWN